MSDPYRTSGGQACPRCRNVLVRETDDWLYCTGGCGTWLGNRVIKTLLDPALLVKSTGNPFRATALPPTKCLVCKQPLNDLYKGAVDVLTLGQCTAHGVWLEQADRTVFEALYAPEIHRTAEVAERQELESLDPHVAALIVRVEKLEEIVVRLDGELAGLRARMP